MPADTAPNVLVVEDDPPTARILTNVLHEIDASIETDVVRDGRECLAVLHGEDDTVADPDIVLLDLNLIDVDGLSVLEQWPPDSTVGRPPIIVVSGENDSQTIVECYDLGANTYFEKPDDLDGYLELAECIIGYWFDNAELPSHHLEP